MRSPIGRFARAVVTLVAFACGNAGAADVVPIRIIGFNDFHGHLEPADNALAVPDPTGRTRTVLLRAGGAAWLAGTIAQLRAESVHNVVVSSGDLIGASPLVSGLFHDEPTIEVMNAIGLDINALGNHEFDRGSAELRRMIDGGCRSEPVGARASCSGDAPFGGSRSAFIAANVVDRATSQPFVSPSVVRHFDGVAVGFIGAVTRSTPGIVLPSGVRGLSFDDEAQAINAEAVRLKATGVRTLVATIHEGGEVDGDFNECTHPRGAIFEIARKLDPAIGIVLSGHTHRAYRCVIESRVIVQAASFGRLVSVVDIAVDRASGKLVVEQTRVRNVPVANGLDRDTRLRSAYPPAPPDTKVAQIVAQYGERAAPIANRSVGRIAQPFERRASNGGDHALGRLIADAQLAATRVSGAQVAFTNPGGIRTDLRSSQPDGTITFADAFAAQPFGNTLVTLTLTGSQLRRLLEQQWSESGRARMLQPSEGFRYAWSASQPAGQRILPETMQLDGRPIEPDGRYRVTLNNFLADGGDGFAVVREATDRAGGALDVDALVEFLRARTAAAPIAPSTAARISRRP